MSVQKGVSGVKSRSGVVARSIKLPMVSAMLIVLGGGNAISAEDLTTAPDFTKRLYLNGGVGLTQIEPESPSDALTVSDDTDVGGHIAIGYDISRIFSVEGYFADLGTADIDFLGDSVGSIDYQVFGLSLLGYLYNSQSGFSFRDSDIDGLFRREGLSLYGRAGIGHIDNDADQVAFTRENPNHAAFGLGLEYGFTNGIALRTEVTSFDTDAQYWNVGVLKRFGSVAAPAAAALVPAAVAIAAPEAPAAPVEVAVTPVTPPFVYFLFDRSELTEEAKGKLDTFAAAVAEDDRTFIVNGHTDWIAPEQYNMSLSVRRAEAVANYLVGQGIDRQRVTTIGYGETRPISNNNTENGRALNRRSEIQIR